MFSRIKYVNRTIDSGTYSNHAFVGCIINRFDFLMVLIAKSVRDRAQRRRRMRTGRFRGRWLITH